MSDPHPLEVTIETAIDGVHAEDFHRLYLDAFEPLQTLAAARQVLHRDEFMEDMQDPGCSSTSSGARAGRSRWPP